MMALVSVPVCLQCPLPVPQEEEAHTRVFRFQGLNVSFLKALLVGQAFAGGKKSIWGPDNSIGFVPSPTSGFPRPARSDP